MADLRLGGATYCNGMMRRRMILISGEMLANAQGFRLNVGTKSELSMEQIEFERALAEFEYSLITQLHIDPFRNRVVIEAVVDTDSEKGSHQVLFEQVASVFWANAPGNDRFDIKPSDGIIWESCLYYPQGLGRVNLFSQPEANLWADQFTGVPNFSLALHDGGLFIESSRVVIDRVAYGVGFPSPSTR